MKILDKKDLRFLKKAVIKSTQPVLETVCYTGTEFLATNLDMLIRVEGKLEGLEPGCYLPAGIEAVMAGAKSAKMICPEEEFPKDFLNRGSKTFAVNPEAAEYFGEAVLFASRDEARYVLNSVYVHENHVAATDGRALYQATLKKAAVRNGKDVIIPLMTAEVIKGRRPRKITVHERREKPHSAPSILFEGEGWSVHSKLIEGRYPPYRQVIPSETYPLVDIPDGLAKIAASRPGRRVAVWNGDLKVKTNPSFKGEREEVAVFEAELPEGAAPFALDLYYVNAARKAGVGRLAVCGPEGFDPSVCRGDSKTVVIMPMRP